MRSTSCGSINASASSLPQTRWPSGRSARDCADRPLGHRVCGRLEAEALMDPQLVDRIYECAFVPELWPSVLDDLARIADARGGFLFAANKEVLNWTCLLYTSPSPRD